MCADIVQAQYEQLEQIAARFAAAAETQQALLQRVNQRVDVLRQGSWRGKGVAAFLQEMDGEVGPAHHRLIDSLQNADRTTTAMSATIREAEISAAALFQDGRGTIDELERVEIPKQPDSIYIGDHLVRDPSKHIFTDSYLQTLKGSHFSGENTPQLNRAMEQLLTDKNLTEQERNKLLDRIANMRGRSPIEFREEYQRFLAIRNRTAHPNDIEVLDQLFHPNHLGSTNSLRFGKVVGDTFGIDPVFGAMLNPTGGMPGPGNWAYEASQDDPVGYHSVAHDAGGFLYYQFNIGPGYDYLGIERSRDPGDPITGQRSGLVYWLSQTDSGRPLSTVIDVVPNPIHRALINLGIERLNTDRHRAGTIDTIFDTYEAFDAVKPIWNTLRIL